MVKFLKPNKAVIVLQGRFAGLRRRHAGSGLWALLGGRHRQVPEEGDP
ncbi:unnamed protein product [Musa acuminata subsp. malaccensis]|uniref:(wild Malaysian banana) hypothetical protein n=1 Tax=Musa acuminata subsp. malaccensis TaxID=214687 RepID=A0A804IIX7_MUSAM|nr:unnamed protein product [Musa acuminata subsp. malaccensis]